MTNHRTIAPVLTEGLKHYIGSASEDTARYAVANLARLIGQVRLTRFTAATVSTYRKRRAADGSTPATRNREVGVLRAILRRAVDRGARVKLPLAWGQEREAVRSRVLTLDEYQRLAREIEADRWSSDVLKVLLATGARVGELLNAEVADVSFSQAEGTGTIIVADPKEGEPKVLVATNGAVAALERLWLTAREIGSRRLLARPGDSCRPFSTPSADYQRIRWHLSRAVRRAELDNEVHLHDLRRTFGSWALQAGATLEQVGQSLGHKSVQTTRRAYARIDEGTRARVGDLVTGQLGTNHRR